MIDGFTEAQIIGGLIALLVALLAAFFAWIVRRFDRLDDKIARVEGKIDRLDEKFEGEFRTVYAKIESLTIAVSRLEGAVYHGLPEPRRAISEG
jgi:hypothetical protein